MVVEIWQGYKRITRRNKVVSILVLSIVEWNDTVGERKGERL